MGDVDAAAQEADMDQPDMGDVNKHIDKVTEHHRQTWWKSLSDDQQLAWSVLIGAAVIGPLGMSVLAGLGTLYSSQVPTSNQFEAVFLLALLTAPVFFGLAALVALSRYGANAFIGAGIAAAIGGYVTSSLGPATSLGDFYCYRSFNTLEHACRAFDQAGFQLAVQSSGGGPTGGARILGFAFSYTADARGALMAVCGVAAGAAAGYLIRVHNQTN